MKRIISILVAASLWACKQSEGNSTETSSLNFKRDEKDSVLFLSYTYNIKDSSIENTTSGKQVDILFNGVKDYLGGQQNANVRFETECMGCEPLQAYKAGFLFAKRLFFDSDRVTYYSNDINISDTANDIRRIGLHPEGKKKNFNFEEGKGIMNYQGQSCNDADYVEIDLQYNEGFINVDKFINASFFEFDLNKDGNAEQFLLGSRNCSQELVILRVR